ncbi:MAG TPA: metallophosphoesterase [Acidimicrobiia bacterium]|nr:metallophosphoesterase [Acidimicrobiia bacterium]
MFSRSRRAGRFAALVAAALAAALVAPLPAAPPATAAPVASSSSGSSSSRTSITLARPAGTVAGHVMVASIVTHDDLAFSAPAGWTAVRNDAIPDVLRQAVYVKVAAASEPSSYTWTLPEWRRVAGGITAYSGIDAAHPVDASAASPAAASGAAVTAPSLTTSVAGATVVQFAAVRAEGSLSPPPGMAERWEAASRNTSNANDVLASSSDTVQAAAGATGQHTATATSPGPRIGAVVALRPAGSVPPPDPDPDPDPPPSGDPVLVGAGDIAGCDVNGDEATAKLLDGIPGTVFTTGDNVYRSATAKEFADCYQPNWGRHKARTLPVAGNHEYSSAGPGGYYTYYGAAAGDPARGYYDTRVGAWHVIVLNSNCAAVGGCGAGSAQEQWLRSVLAASDAQCTVALWHHPRFSSASNDPNKLTFKAFWQALYEYGAEVVLAGHDHVYERFGLQDPSGNADAAFGLRQFTVGSGGKSHQSFKAAQPNSDVRNGSTYGVLKLTLHADSYDWQFVPVAGKTFTDTGTTACHGAPAPPPPPPDPPLPDPAGISRVASSSSGSSSSRADVTLARPAGTAAGHVMVASIVSNDDQPGFTAPAGWTAVRDDTVAGALRQTVYVKVAGPSEPPSYTWSLGAWRRIAGGITTYAGVDPATPVDAAASAAHPAGGTAVTAPEVTTSVAGAMLVHLAAVRAEGGISPPANMTERWEALSRNATTTADALASSSDAPWATVGATGPRSATATGSGPRIGALVALRPTAP